MPGRTINNGYGKEHKRLRAAIAQRMRAGEIFRCWRCGQLINPRLPWDLGHDDADRTRYRGPEHVACNRAHTRRRAKLAGRGRGAVPAPRRWLL